MLAGRPLASSTFALFGILCTQGACSDEAPSGALASPEPPPTSGELTYRSEVTPIRSAQDALEGVFIPPYEDCRDPLPNDTGSSPDGKVCTQVLINGCTEPGKHFADYASCDVVRTQRPFWQRPPTKEPDPNDPRLSDAAFMGELAWVTQQIEACGCSCCHDSRTFDGKFGQWDINRGPIWLDTLSDSGLALFAGLADSSALGAFPPERNHGFDRTATGIPTTDTARMQAFVKQELARRGISEEQARAVTPFGGPIYTFTSATPPACKPGEDITSGGTVRWLGGGRARYVYVLEAGTKNPGVPPNADIPQGTLWRLDVLPNQPALTSGIRYGQTPEGTFQTTPEASPAPALEKGKKYHLVVLDDPGLALAACEFTFGS
ncbi:MAG: hypothetical protein QM778_16360 [Myxococcales bacterium]